MKIEAKSMDKKTIDDVFRQLEERQNAIKSPKTTDKTIGQMFTSPPEGLTKYNNISSRAVEITRITPPADLKRFLSPNSGYPNVLTLPVNVRVRDESAGKRIMKIEAIAAGSIFLLDITNKGTGKLTFFEDAVQAITQILKVANPVWTIEGESSDNIVMMFFEAVQADCIFALDINSKGTGTLFIIKDFANAFLKTLKLVDAVHAKIKGSKPKKDTNKLDAAP